MLPARLLACSPARLLACSCTSLLLTMPAGAWEDPLQDPDADGNVLGGAMIGDHPPDSCWTPTTSAIRLAGPLHDGQAAVHVAGGATAGTQRVGIGIFASPSWSCTLPGVSSYLCPTPIAGVTGDEAWYFWWDATTTLDSPTVRLLAPPDPAEVLDPVLAYPVDTNTRAVSALLVHPGAEVSVTIGGTTWTGYAHDRGRATIAIPPGTPAGSTITLQQSVGGVTASSTATSVGGTAGPYSVRLPWGVERGAVAVAVAGYTPGSKVTVKDTATGSILGSSFLAEPMGVVPICAAPASVTVEAQRNGVTVSAVRQTQDWSPGTLAISRYTSIMGPLPDCWLNPFDPICFWADNPLGGAFHPGWSRFRVVEPYPSHTGRNAVVFIMHGRNDDDPEGQCDISGFGSYFPPGPGIEEWDEIESDRDDSFLAYEQLSEKLARSGFEVVSFEVHPNSEQQTRSAWFYSFVERYLGTRETPIALIGHSMGSGAIPQAAQWLQDFGGRDVRALVGLGHAKFSSFDPDEIPTSEVPFLFLDGDEDGFWTSNEPNGYAVSAIWPWPVAHTTLPGATHAGFNECWNYGRHGDNPMMSREAQLRITSTLVQRFLTMVFDAYDGPTPSADLTRGFATQFGGALSPLGLNSYRPRYLWRAGSRHSIEDFQSSPDHENEHGLANTGTGSLTFNEGSPLDFEYTAPDNRVVRLSWTDAATYRLGLDPSTPGFSPAETDLLTFDALVALDSVNPEFLAQEFVVELRDSDNDVARVAVGAVNELDPAMGSHSHRTTRFETLSIPLSAFRAVNPSLALSSINRLAFRFAAGTQGVIYLDNIAFTSQ